MSISACAHPCTLQCSSVHFYTQSLLLLLFCCGTQKYRWTHAALPKRQIQNGCFLSLPGRVERDRSLKRDTSTGLACTSINPSRCTDHRPSAEESGQQRSASRGQTIRIEQRGACRFYRSACLSVQPSIHDIQLSFHASVILFLPSLSPTSSFNLHYPSLFSPPPYL